MDRPRGPAGALLVVGALGALYRIVRGPSLLDRAIATDVLLVVFSGMLVLEMAVHRHTHHVVLVVLAAAV
ncbi:sodium:proton antiporter, partial [Micrococcus luteus]